MAWLGQAGCGLARRGMEKGDDRVSIIPGIIFMVIILSELKKHIRKGKTIVLAHGVFDVLHAGHIQHLREAKKHGDVLVVSISPDQYVNKGPGRPIFNQDVRATVVDALEMVDYVVINNEPDALDVLRELMPEVFCKGSEVLDCPSGHIHRELEFVKSYDGEMVFIDMVGEDNPISSSRIINSLLPEPASELSQIASEISFGDLEGYFEEIVQLKILVVGEYILDDYIICSPLERASKEMLVPMLYKDQKLFSGGAAIVANNMSQFCNSVSLLTFCDPKDGLYIRLASKGRVRLLRCDHSTIKKQRLIEEGSRQKVSELTYMESEIKCEEQVHQHLIDTLPDIDLVICTDYGHGLFTPSIIGRIMGGPGFIGVTAQANAANYGFNLITKWVGAEYLVVDEKELRLATGRQFGDIKDMLPDIMDTTGAALICTTLGSRGCTLYDGQDFHYIPAIPAPVVDTMGAGDAFLAITAPFAKLGLPPKVIGLIGNAYAAMKVGILGNKPVDPITFKKFLKTLWA